ncbi:hypothetical protein LLEC1_08021 [Akanthomyces lecanii]|uniref:NADH dehydrogenase [ubiquinone] 1 alpha subcomplex subunit 13 n=1 Tax=Cordyceps confragosa TaxID=2714763 RepID=A0A179I9Q1_CORDF|nr:hypothetical protein LLEC1_08021 [Akanthomyces lecanii]
MAQDMPPKGGYQPVQYKSLRRPAVRSGRQLASGAHPERSLCQCDIESSLRHLSQRNLPARGFRPGTLLIGMGIVMSYGWYKLFHGIREAKYVAIVKTPFDKSITGRNTNTYPCYSELAREKMWARINLIPLLQAEEDRDQVRRYWADQKREKELLGENTKVYHNDRFVRPTLAVAPAPSK